jgi:hypothetical protein
MRPNPTGQGQVQGQGLGQGQEGEGDVKQEEGNEMVSPVTNQKTDANTVIG